MGAVVTREEAIGALVGGAIAALGVWLWFETVALWPFAIVLFGGFVCGAIGGNSGNDGLEVAMGQVLPVVLALAIGWVFVQIATSGGDQFLALAGFVLLVSVILSYLPLLFLPFAVASAMGGWISGKAAGGSREPAD